MTNNYPNAIIPHRDSIWTQNYTLAEITGILYKNSLPESGNGNGRIYENYKRYEPVSMITKALQQLWEFWEAVEDHAFRVQKTGLNIQGINQKRFGVKVYPGALF